MVLPSIDPLIARGSRSDHRVHRRGLCPVHRFRRRPPALLSGDLEQPLVSARRFRGHQLYVELGLCGVRRDRLMDWRVPVDHRPGPGFAASPRVSKGLSRRERDAGRKSKDGCDGFLGCIFAGGRADRGRGCRCAQAGRAKGRAGSGRRSGNPAGQAAGQNSDAPDPDPRGAGLRDRRRRRRPASMSMRSATGLKHPRWLCVLPNGDVLAAEALLTQPEPVTSLFDYAMFSHAETGGRHGREPQPHHAFARRRPRRGRRDPERVSRPAASAVRHGAYWRHVLRRRHGRAVVPRYMKGAKSDQGEPGWRPTRITGGTGPRIFCGRPARPSLHRGGIAHQYRRKGHGGRTGARRIHEFDLDTGQPHLCLRIAQSCGPRVGASDGGRLWTAVNERDGLGNEPPIT